MRRFYLMLLALMFVLPVQALESWVTFKDEKSVFSVEVPVAPAVVHNFTPLDDGSQAATSSYTVDRGEVAMMVMVGDLSGINKTHDAVLDDSVAGVAEGKTVLSKTIDTLDGHVGRYVKILDKDGNRYIDRVFFIEGKLYQLITVEFPTASAEKRAEVERFANSLHFLPKQKPAKK